MAGMVSSEEQRAAMVASQLRPVGVNDPLLIKALLTVPREPFVPEAFAHVAYVDRPIELAAGRYINATESTGLLLNALRAEAGERALVVGAATGWSAALLAEMGCHVVALESDEALAARARELLAGTTVEVVAGPLTGGHAVRAPYQIILVDGAVEYIPDALIDQLEVGGRLAAALVEDGVTRLVLGRRTPGGAFGVQAFTDNSAARLPGFEKPRVFTF